MQAIVTGKPYALKRVTLGLLRQVAAFERESGLSQFNPLAEGEEYEKMKTAWREYCGLVLEAPDAEVLDVDALTMEDVRGVIASFTRAAFGTEPKPTEQ